MPASFWNVIAKCLVKLAVYAVGHPADVQRVLNVIKDARKAKA